jgi:hypothetical protein
VQIAVSPGNHFQLILGLRGIEWVIFVDNAQKTGLEIAMILHGKN